MSIFDMSRYFLSLTVSNVQLLDCLTKLSNLLAKQRLLSCSKKSPNKFKASDETVSNHNNRFSNSASDDGSNNNSNNFATIREWKYVLMSKLLMLRVTYNLIYLLYK